MEWRKGFLSEPPPRKPKQRKQNALPDEAFLPTESYDLADDDGVQKHRAPTPGPSRLCRLYNRSRGAA